MKNLLLGVLVLFILESCVARALNNITMGMSIQEFMTLSKNRATLESSSDGRTVDRYAWAPPGSEITWNTTFYYFQNDKLVQFDAGVRNSPPPQLRLNYNLN